MAFIFKRKRFKFIVSFEVIELSLTPLVNGRLFAKIRLTNGGSFEEYTTREEVCNHRVEWRKKCQYESRIYANNSTGELETCICRVSVRKESKGGKSYTKLGFADVNLSEFAGSGHTSRRYLLEGYNSKSRLDNSMLNVSVEMKLLSGDPVFKVPKPKMIVDLPDQIPSDLDLQPDNKGGAVSGSEDSVASGSSGFGSLTRSKKEANEQQVTKDNSQESSDPSTNTVKLEEDHDAFDPGAVGDGHQLAPSSSFQGQGQGQVPGHVRNNSSASSLSKVSGYHSLGGIAVSHSRQSSDGSSTPLNSHKRSCSVDASDNLKISSLSPRSKKIEGASSIEQRLGSTRLDAEQVIENLMKGTDFHKDDSTDKPGLELYVGTDGSTSFSSHHLREKAGKYERVVIGDR